MLIGVREIYEYVAENGTVEMDVLVMRFHEHLDVIRIRQKLSKLEHCGMIHRIHNEKGRLIRVQTVER